jgi:hypothetical protein
VSLLLAGTAAVTYLGIFVGLHRLGVWTRRRAVQGMPVLTRLDWDTLLAHTPAEDDAQHSLHVRVLAGGADILAEATGAGYAPEAARWLETLALIHARPGLALERLESAPATHLEAVYLREFLRLQLEARPWNLEWVAFAAKRRLHAALLRFGDVAPLYFVRARASALLGFNATAVDDLGRAVYFSRQAPFYVRAVLDTPAIRELRPSLFENCRELIGQGGAAT